MTKYTFNLKNKNNDNSFIYTNPSSKPDYSKMLDDLIASDIAAKNEYLFGDYNKPTTETIKIKIKNNSEDSIINNIIDDASKKKITIIDACNFFSNFKKNNFGPFIKDKIYYLSDGTPFYLTDDYITIGFDTYYFYEFGKPTFLSTISDSFKKTIMTIFIDGLKITIKK